MSADNYYLIRKHPDGGFAAVMGFASDDRTPQAHRLHPRFNSVDAAVKYAMRDWTKCRVDIHPECEASHD